MALKQNFTFKGIQVNDTYLKIVSVNFGDYVEEELKKYQARITVFRYTNNTKQDLLEQLEFTFSGLNYSDITLANLYELLKSELTDTIDC